MVNMNAASTQWASRPADERFNSLDRMYEEAHARQGRSTMSNVNLGVIKVIPDPENENGIVAEGRQSYAYFTNFAFKQLLNIVNYPAGGIFNNDGVLLPSDLVCDIINYRISDTSRENPIQILSENKGDEGIYIRALTSSLYDRVYDATIIKFMQKLHRDSGWIVPPARPAFENQPGTRPATLEDISILNQMSGMGSQVFEGDLIAPAGLYMSDRNSFVFLMNPKGESSDDGGDSLLRIVMVQNSEVGDCAFKMTECLCQGVCGNHIIWGARDIVKIKYKHIGDASTRIIEALSNLTQTLDTPRDLTQEFRVIKWMRNTPIGLDIESTQENIYKILDKKVPQKTIREAYILAERYRDVSGDPNTFYGIANGITRFSQTVSNMDKRAALDESAAVLFSHAHANMG